MMKLPAMIKTLNGDSNIYNKNLGFSMSCTLLGQGHKTTLFPDSCVGLVLNEKKINDLNILFATKENFGSTVYFESNRTDIGLTKDISKKAI